jgi:hypothetical protein
MRNSTVIGRVHAEAMTLVENSILLARPSGTSPPVEVRRRQEGCVRFSYVPLGSRVPRRYRCQPPRRAVVDRARPALGSARYIDPNYCQLSRDTPDVVRRGADDGSEMGAFHDVYLPLRESHLEARLREYLRFGLEVGVFFVT